MPCFSELVDYNLANMPDYLTIREREGKIAFSILGPMAFNPAMQVATGQAQQPRLLWGTFFRVTDNPGEMPAHQFRRDDVNVNINPGKWISDVEAEGWETISVAGPLLLASQQKIEIPGQPPPAPDMRLVFFLRRPTGLTIGQTLDKLAEEKHNFRFTMPPPCPACGSEKVRQTSNRAQLECIACKNVFVPQNGSP